MSPFTPSTIRAGGTTSDFCSARAAGAFWRGISRSGVRESEAADSCAGKVGVFRRVVFICGRFWQSSSNGGDCRNTRTFDYKIVVKSAANSSAQQH